MTRRPEPGGAEHCSEGGEKGADLLMQNKVRGAWERALQSMLKKKIKHKGTKLTDYI